MNMQHTLCGSIDPHPQWLEDWRGLNQRFLDTESEALLSDLNRLADLIVKTPATTPEGMLAKAQYVRATGVDGGEPLIILIQFEAFVGALREIA